MTAHRDLKKIIRERQTKTGESYTAARAHVMHERAKLIGQSANETENLENRRLHAVILKVNQQSARVRILGESDQVTFRSADVWRVVPGHFVSLVLDRRWVWRSDAYASGRIESICIAPDKLGLVALPLRGGELVDAAAAYEPFLPSDPYAPLWVRLTAAPRTAREFDAIAWGQLPGRDLEDNPVCDAAELLDKGDHVGARELLMGALGEDLRCIDAHAHLGNLEFDQSSERAMMHYEIGVRIGELSLVGYDGMLLWGRIYNRPFLRCLHGYGLCLWRLGRTADAQRVFERILAFNPSDNQGVRFCWDDVRHGRSWDQMQAREAEQHGGQLALAHDPTPAEALDAVDSGVGNLCSLA